MSPEQSAVEYARAEVALRRLRVQFRDRPLCEWYEVDSAYDGPFGVEEYDPGTPKCTFGPNDNRCDVCESCVPMFEAVVKAKADRHRARVRMIRAFTREAKTSE